MEENITYRIKSPHGEGFLDGYFINGNFYQNDHRIGWLDASTFIYCAGQANGQPAFPDMVGGHVSGLVLTMKDGTELQLVAIEGE